MALLEEASSSPSSTNDLKYDVYLSFFGTDTRRSFTAHLHKALENANLVSFLDEQSIQKGENWKVELESAIKASRASVIVLSKNYASSAWCLDELVLILKQRRNSKHIVIPIFYHVEPSHVRNQQSSFGDAMKKHKHKMKAETNAERKSQLAIWKAALTEVANLMGIHYVHDRLETEHIQEIVVDIYHSLGATRCRSLSPELIGMDKQMDSISSWLKDESSHTADILTIVGMGGIGKTTLARRVYVSNSHEFERSGFIDNISSTIRSKQSDELLNMQIQLFSQISETSSVPDNNVFDYTAKSKEALTSSVQENNVFDYTAKIKKALQGKKVLLVLDDVDSLDHLNVLLGDEGFHRGSKIIITTRDASLIDRYLLFNPSVKPKRTMLPLKGLDDTSSLQLFRFFAFNRTGPTEDYEHLCKMIVKYCEGLPLALKVLGSSLRDRDVAEWKAYLERLKHIPDSRIQKVLQENFESLPYRNDKELFLHIACFFVGMDRDVTETILDACDIITVHGISTLIDRSLLTIGPANKLMMHPLLQEMGRDVVRQESPNKPWERSRLWCLDDLFEVLEQKEGSTNLLGLTLDMKQEKEKLHAVEIEIDALSKMENLMLLQLNHVKLKGSYKNFPEELRWLCMHGFPLRSIPSDLPMENLVALDLSYSKIEFFDMSYSNPQELGKTPTEQTGPSSNDERLLGSLKILNLSFCEQLQSVSGFVNLPALERLILSNCNGLIEVSESIGHCVELVTIDVSYCRKLERLPTTLKKLTKLKAILQDGCNLVDAGLR